MDAILFTVAAVTFVWLLIVAPNVIRQHRGWKTLQALKVTMPVEEALYSLAESVALVGAAASQAKNNFKALAEALSAYPKGK